MNENDGILIAMDDTTYLNNILERIGVKGFSFIPLEPEGFSIVVPFTPGFFEEENLKLSEFGSWKSLNDLFKYKTNINIMLYRISLSRKNENSKFLFVVDYPKINDNGINFLKCLYDSDSKEELELKLQIMGYGL